MLCGPTGAHFLAAYETTRHYSMLCAAGYTAGAIARRVTFERIDPNHKTLNLARRHSFSRPMGFMI
jgi:hypothetical protein